MLRYKNPNQHHPTLVDILAQAQAKTHMTRCLSSEQAKDKKAYNLLSGVCLLHLVLGFCLWF